MSDTESIVVIVLKRPSWIGLSLHCVGCGMKNAQVFKYSNPEEVYCLPYEK
jgi:hypothetical protein